MGNQDTKHKANNIQPLDAKKDEKKLKELEQHVRKAINDVIEKSEEESKKYGKVSFHKDLIAFRDSYFGSPTQIRQRIIEFHILCFHAKHLLLQLSIATYQLKVKFVQLFLAFKPFAQRALALLPRLAATASITARFIVSVPLYILNSTITFTTGTVLPTMYGLYVIAKDTFLAWKLKGSAFLSSLKQAFLSSKTLATIKSGGKIFIDFAKRGITNAAIVAYKVGEQIVLKIAGGIASAVEIAAVKLVAGLMMAAAAGWCVGTLLDKFAQRGAIVAQAIQKPISGLFVHLFLDPGPNKKWSYNSKTGGWEPVEKTTVSITPYLTRQEQNFLNLRAIASDMKKDSLRRVLYGQSLDEMVILPSDYVKNMNREDILYSTEESRIEINIIEFKNRENQSNLPNRLAKDGLYLQPLLKAIDNQTGTEYEISPYISINENELSINENNYYQQQYKQLAREVERLTTHQGLLNIVETSIKKRDKEINDYKENGYLPAKRDYIALNLYYFRVRTCWYIRKYLHFYEKIIGKKSATRLILIKLSNPDGWKNISIEQTQKRVKLLERVIEVTLNSAKRKATGKKNKHIYSRLEDYQKKLFDLTKLKNNAFTFDHERSITKMKEKSKGYMSYYAHLYLSYAEKPEVISIIEKKIKKLKDPNLARALTYSNVTNKFLGKKKSKTKAKSSAHFIRSRVKALMSLHKDYLNKAKSFKTTLNKKKKELEKLNKQKDELKKPLFILSLVNFNLYHNRISTLNYPKILRTRYR